MGTARRQLAFLGVLGVGIVFWFVLTDLSAVLLCFVLFGGFWVVTGSMGLRAYARMARTDTTDVADVRAPERGIALVGTAKPAGQTVRAPVSGEESLAARAKVEIYTQADAGDGASGNWGPVGDKDVYVPFLLEDATGSIFVDPNGAYWSFEEETWEVDAGEEPPAPIREFLEGTGSPREPMSEIVHDHDRRFKEARLDPGEEVYVYGTAKAGPAEGGPAGTVEPYVGSEAIDEGDSGHVENSLSWSLLPFVPGDPSESELFTVADTRERGAQRRLLKTGAGVTAGGVVILLVGIFIEFWAA